MTGQIRVDMLGQAGVRLALGNLSIYLDPYLTDRVADQYGPQLRRLVPPPIRAEEITDADWVLITHAHEDHCDTSTLLPLLASSSKAKTLCAAPAAQRLRDAGVNASRIFVAEERWHDLGDGVRVHPVPAAHPRVSRDEQGRLECVGFVLESGARRVYHAGDTSPDEGLFSALRRLSPIDVAFLPVNERNFFRDRAGIVGNMSVREAFGFALEMGIRAVVPVHWDLFGPNSVLREEIELLHAHLRPDFALFVAPSEI